MLIAFEGPDNTGKSTSAANLSHNGQPIYNATKENHEYALTAGDKDLVQCFDRIDWFSHMVYRLALPDHDWNDDRPRTVFAMPDTHLVIKLHLPEMAVLITDELYTSGTVALVNPVYSNFASYFMHLNRAQGYSLFRSITVIEVNNDPVAGTFSQTIAAHESAVEFEAAVSFSSDDDTMLLEFLRHVESHTA